MPDYPLGTILELPIPSSRSGASYGASGEGEPRSFPAMVLGQFSDGALQLFVFHFEGQFQQVISASVAVTLPVLYRPGEIRELRETVAWMQGRIDELTAHLDPVRSADPPVFDMDALETVPFSRPKRTR